MTPEIVTTWQALAQLPELAEEAEAELHFLTGEDYPHLCRTCQNTISMIAMLYQEGDMPDTDDNEAPLLWVGDNRLMCHGDHCENSDSCYCHEHLAVCPECDKPQSFPVYLKAYDDREFPLPVCWQCRSNGQHAQVPTEGRNYLAYIEALRANDWSGLAQFLGLPELQR